MRSYLALGIACIAAAASVPCIAQQARGESPQTGYSVTPLHDPLFNEAQVVVETTALNNWLNANIRKLTYEQMKGPREHLYYLIDSRVKQIYAVEKRVLPKQQDPLLETLFSWSERLGVFGGAYAFNAVKAPDSPSKTPGMRLPPGIELVLNNDLLTLRSDLGWSITIPYYFMIWNVADFTAKDGPRTQLVALSTGAAKDKSEAGRSQATVIFMFSPGKEFESFDGYWSRQMNVGMDVKPMPLGVKSLQSRHVVNELQKLHTEFTSWSEPIGSIAVAYLGVEGTYEWNRPHFVDFLRSVETNTQLRPDNRLERQRRE
jgi:hypothetical protein